MKYIANPIQVEAFAIVGIVAVADMDERFRRERGRSSGVALVLDDGTLALPTPEMMARMTPAVGDYWVVQDDGYNYLNPKAVFERKYRKAQPEELAKTATIGIFGK